MKASKRILLYGNSLILGSIGAVLRRFPQFEVTTLATPLQEAQAFDNVNPDILLFDLEAPNTETLFFLPITNEAFMMIGISPGINLVRVWNSQQLKGMSMQNLIDLINNNEKSDN